MAEDAIEEEDVGADGEEENDAPSTKKTPGKVIVLKFVLPILLLLGGGAGAYFGGLLDSVLGTGPGAEVAQEETEEPPGEVIYYDLPEMLVNLNSRGRRIHYLKISVSLEIPHEEDISRLDAVLPRIVDEFQVYLRELRVDDLQGSAGLYRLREELLSRVALAAAPATVSDVLFREMLIQ